MKKISDSFCYYRVFENDTVVTLVSFNDFKPVKFQNSTKVISASHFLEDQARASHPIYSLAPDEEMYYGYVGEIYAMEKAKEGALKYIEYLVKQGAESAERLYQYRYDHYEDLNVNLLDARIRRLKELK